MPITDASRPPHEQLLVSLSEQEWHLWRHNPITSAYLLYLADQAEAFRTAAADLLEGGNLAQFDATCRKLLVMRGQMTSFTELQNLSLGDIQNFYRQEDTAGTDDKRPD